jgi:hypothetical protein
MQRKLLAVVFTLLMAAMTTACAQAAQGGLGSAAESSEPIHPRSLIEGG